MARLGLAAGSGARSVGDSPVNETHDSVVGKACDEHSELEVKI